MSAGPIIGIHGGAWAIPEHLLQLSIEGVKKAALKGLKVLQDKRSALYAVQAAVINLENNLVFDAGKGSVLTFDEEAEMDALLMDGKNLRAGTVAAIKNIQNPIKVTRLVLDNTSHVVLVGEGANKFATSQGIHPVSPDSLLMQEAKDQLAKYKIFNKAIGSLFSNTSVDSGHDNIGCSALDSEVHVACGTLTGGITAKLQGRVGDFPILGAGGITDDETGVNSCTRHREATAKCCLAKDVLYNIHKGKTASESLRTSLNYMKRRLNAYGGAICVTHKGDFAAEFYTERMFCAYVKNNKLHYGFHPNQHEITQIHTDIS